MLKFWLVGTIVVIVLYVSYKIFFKNSIYAEVYSDKHLLEFAKGILELKLKAIDNVLGSNSSSTQVSEQQRLVTSTGVKVMYDIIFENDSYQHHFSMSHKTEMLARNAASDLTGYLLSVLRLDKFDFEFTLSNNGIYHLHIVLDGDKHSDYIAEGAQVPDKNSLMSMFSDCIRQRSKYMDNLAPVKVDFLELGKFYYQQGEKQLAIQSFLKAIEVAPSSISAYFALAKIYDELEMKEAAEFLAKGLELCEERGLDPIEFGVFMNPP